MSSVADQTHGQSISFPVEPHMPLVKNTPRLECAILNTPMKTEHLQSSVEAFISCAIVDMDERPANSILGDGTQSNIDHITSLERTVCSNFFCCGIQHSDFHALLEHFEGDHLVVLAPNGKRVYPVALDPSSGESTPTSSRSSSVSPSTPGSPIIPPYLIPSSPSDVLPPISYTNRKSGLPMPPVYTPFTPCWPVDPAYSMPDNAEIVTVQEPNFDFSTQPSLLPPMQLEVPESPESRESEIGDDESMASADDILSSPLVRATEPDGLSVPQTPKSIRSSAKGKRPSGTPSRQPTTAKPGKSRRGTSSSSSHSRRREKMFRCPKHGCIKSYLNPNGLKYHLEKGTCKMEDDEMGPSTEQPTETCLTSSNAQPDSNSGIDLSPPVSPTRQSLPTAAEDQTSILIRPLLAKRDSEVSIVSPNASHQSTSCIALMPPTSSLLQHDLVTQPVPSPQTSPRSLQASFANGIQQQHQFVGHPLEHQLRRYQHVQNQRLSLATEPHARRTSSQGSVVSHTQSHYHYPIPSYPQGYNQPQHRTHYHDTVAYLPTPLIGAAGSASAATSQ